MGQKDVYNNPNLFPGTDFKYIVRSAPSTGITLTALAVANTTRNTFGGLGVDVVLNAQKDERSETAAPILQDADVIQVGWNPGSKLSHSDVYFTFLRILPCSAYDAKFIAQNIQNQFGWNRIAVFSVSDDINSVDGLVEFTEEAASVGLNIITPVSFSQTATDLSAPIATIAQYEPRVILLMMPPQSTVRFLQQAYKKGLVKEGVTVIGTSYSAPSTMMSFFNKTDDVASMMKGFMVFQANVNWTSTAMGKQFISRFQSWPDSISYSLTGKPICHNDTDDEGWYTYHEKPTNFNVSLGYTCGGIQPSKFNAANIDPLTGYIYDAMQAVSRGIDFMVRNATSPITKISGRALKRIIVDHVRFEGVTGTVSFSSGRTSMSNYGYGDRIDRIPYLISNFNNASYMKTGKPFRTIGYYDADLVYTACNPLNDFSCSKPIFNTMDNTVPSDSPASLFVEMSPTLTIVIIALAVIFMAITAFCMLFATYYRNDTTLKALQPLLLLGTLLGCVMCCSQMIMEALPISNTTCAARAWFIHLAFYLIMGSIAAKMYRIHLVINANGLKKVVVKETFALYLFLGGLASFIVYLIIVATVGAPLAIETFTQSTTGQKTYQGYCKMAQSGVQYFLFIVEAILIIVAIGLNVAISHAPKKLHSGAAKIRSTVYATLYVYCHY